MFNKKLVLIITTIVFILLIFIGILVAILMPKNPQSNQISNNLFGPVTNPLIKYKPGSIDLIAEKMNIRQPLSNKDATIRKSLIQAVGNKSGTLNTTSVYNIEYMMVADSFEVEIKITDIENAKSQAISYFTQKGLSKEGVCNLPTFFYLNYKVAEQLKDENIEFNPLVEGC